MDVIGAYSPFVWGMVQAVAGCVLIWVNFSMMAQRIRSSCAGLTCASIQSSKRTFTKQMDCRV
jgi:hypothetical protein